MPKGLKPILVALGVIVALVVAVVLMVFVFPADDAEAEDEDAEVTATAAATSTTVYVISEDSSELKSYEMIPADGDSMLVEINVDDDGNYSYEVTPYTEYFDYDTSKFRSMIYTVTSITASSVIEENASDLSQYGLAEPQFTLRTTYKDGTVIELYIGNTTPTGNYYVTTNQNDTVYSIGSYVVSLLMRSDIDYRDITLFPTYTDDEIYENINWVKMTLRDGTEIELKLADDDDAEINTSTSAYVMLSPTKGSCNDTNVQEDVLDIVATLSAESILCDITEEDYAEYGFDEPAKLEMTDVDGNSVSILIGGSYSTSYRYIMLEQAPYTVMVASSDAFTWLDINYIELMNRTVWIYNITDTDYIEYNLKGDEYVVDYTHGTTTNEDGEEETTLDVTLNGDTISETNGRRLFVRTLNFRVIGDVDNAASLKTVDSSITIHLTDGTVHTLEFLQINDRKYACRVDGETDFYVYKKNLNTLIDAFATVLNGRELTMSYDS